MDIQQFRFEEIEVDTATRQLTRAGQSLPIEPKVFDVLVLLLRHRQRVVTKQELLAGVWGRMVVTDGVIARTVMKVRKLVGDSADQPSIVRTVHRIGYRFVADVEEGPAASADPDARASAGDRDASRMAVLPFVNDTGSPENAWVDLGLMSTTVNELSRQLGSAAVIPVVDLLAVTAALHAEPTLEEVADRIAHVLGPVDVLRAALSRASGSMLVLDFTAHGPTLGTLRGALTGTDPVRLSQQLAQRIAARFPVPRSGEAGNLPPSAHDRFPAEAHARALKALHEERWGSAGKLLRVALDQLPHDPQLQLDYASCLVGQHDPRAPALLEVALREARQSRHAVRELRALHLLAACRHARGDFVEAERLLGNGLRMAEAMGDAESELQLLIASAQTLICLDKPAVASWMLDRAAELATRLGNQVAMGRLLDVRGRIALYRAQAPRALQAFEDAARLNEQHGLSSGAAYSFTHLGHCLRDLGRTADAATCYLRAFDHAMRSGNPSVCGLSGVCAVRFATGAPADPSLCDELLERMRRSAALPGAVDLAEACILGRRGHLARAVSALDRAEHGVVASPSLGYHLAVLRVRLSVRLGLLEQARDLCDELRACASGRLQRAMRGSSLHLRALVASAEGTLRPALALLHDCLREQLPSMARSDALLDAAWLHLRLGERAEARELLTSIAPFMQAAVASGYAPAVAVQALLLGETGACLSELADVADLDCPPSLFELAPARRMPALQPA